MYKSAPLTLFLPSLTLLALLPGLVAGSARPAVAQDAPPVAALYAFETGAEWQTAKSETAGAGASASVEGGGPTQHSVPGSPGAGTLKVALNLPSAAGIRVAPDRAWRGLSGLDFSVYLPAGAPSSISLGTYVKDNEWWWYQAFPLRHGGGPELTPGRWNRVHVDLSPSAAGWITGGHEKPWADAMRPFLEFGLVFYSRTPFHGTVEISPIRGEKSPAGAAEPVKASQVELSSAAGAAQWSPVTISFHLNRRYSNPFDPDVVDVEGNFSGPEGDVKIPGFAYQDYALQPGKVEPTPRGDLIWQVRFMPTAAGSYTYRITLKDADGPITLTEGAFRCRPEKDRGFVRISEKDHRFFEFDDHSFYYPIGMNVRHAGDMDHIREGMPAIDHYFDRMAAAGLTWVRTWMCSWWLAIEWSHKYDARYHGVGRYNLANAWLLDRTLDVANRDGLYVDLTLNNHGQFSISSDHEWEYNPYNVENGGKLTNPAEFFTDPWARQMFKQRLRYIVARWGYSPNIFAWELFNEVDLTTGYNSHIVSDWMTEMSQYIHSIDPWQHLVTTHVCYWSLDPVLWSNPNLQFVQADAYVRWTHGQDTMATFTDRVWRRKEEFDKPAYIVEFGYKLGKEYQAADPLMQFHPGIWSGFMSPFSADSMFWDWYVVDENNLWPQYAALVRFARGEDRRGQDLKVSLSSVDSAAPLISLGVNNANRAYIWVYNADREGENDPSKFAAVSGAQLLLQGLDDGTYHVEFWDTFKGAVVSQTPSKSEGGALKVSLPPIRIDLAMKIRKTD